MLKFIGALGTFCCMGYYLVCLWGVRAFRRQRRAATPAVTPPVSILKPMRGTDPRAYDSLRSHCVQGYGEYELIFGVSDLNDPAVPLIRRLQQEFPQRSIRLVLCEKNLGANRKTSNLIQMLPHAAHEHLLVNDSDIRVPPDYLRRVLGAFAEPGVGMVTCLYRGVAADTFSSRLESLGISTDFIPGVLAAQQVEQGIHFALGSTLAFTREGLHAIGGLEPLANYLADDFELGLRMATAGFRVVLAGCIVETHLPAYTLSDFLEHQLRWGRSTRNSRPLGYLGLLLTFGLPWALLTLAAARGAPWAFFLFAAALLLRLGVALACGVGVLKDRQVLRFLWMLPLRDLLALVIWFGGLAGRRVTWRGQKFVLKDRQLRPA